MFNRSMLLVGLLVAAVVVPYLLLNERLAQAARTGWSGLVGKAENETESLLAQLTARAHDQPIATSAPPVAIEETFRFDLTPQWVAARWPRVSQVAGERNQLGMRVALVSGTRVDDIAGSLTYYFDEHHQLQRITFTGLTGDPRRLLAAVVTPNGLKSQPTTNAAHYVAGELGRPSSEVIVRHPLAVTGAAQIPRAEVSVDLRRDDALRGRDKPQHEPEGKILSSGYRRW